MKMLQAQGLLHRVDAPLSPRFEIAAVLLARQEEPFLFERVEGSELRVAGNVYATPRLLALALGCSEAELVPRIEAAVNHPQTAGREPYRPGGWAVEEAADLTGLPVLTHYEREAGPYLSAGIVAARMPENGRENLSVHRMLLRGRNEVVARIVPRHLHQIVQERVEVPIAVIVGPSPAVFLATALQPPYGVSEYDIANALLGGRLELTELPNGVAVPVDAELVLEGTLYPRELVAEAPYVDLTGTYDDVRQQPVLRFHRLYRREDAIYQAVVGGSLEHRLFMGLPQELKLRDYLRRVVPRLRGVYLTPGGSGYFHAVLSIGKATDGDGKTAILNAFAASHALKWVIAVDEDIDPSDWAQVEWALATRFQADRGLVVVEGARGSTLDPSSKKTGVTAKLGLDATLPVREPRAPFERAQVVRSPRVAAVLERLAAPSR